MRILFVSQEVPPQTGWGGIGTYVDVLSEAMAAAGAEVEVLSVVDGQPVSREHRGGVTVRRFAAPAVARPAHYLPETWRRVLLSVSIARLIPTLRTRPDVIECPEWMAEGLVLALRNRLPLVVRLHSSARQLFPFTGQGRQWRGLDGRIAGVLEDVSARGANVVVSTRSNLEEVSGRLRLDPDALHAIPYPVRLPELSPLPVDAPPVVAFAGRLETRKGPDVLLRAAPKVLAAVPDAQFVFVGRDVVPAGVRPSSQWLMAEAARLGITHAVTLTGQLDRHGVAREFARATVCAFPSRWESFGNVVAEASAVGRPVVVSPIPSFAELVREGETGRTASLEDPDAWSAAIIDLLRDRDRARAMGEAGAEHVRALSAPDRVAVRALAAHEHAIERWRRGARAGLGHRWSARVVNGGRPARRRSA